MKPATPNFPLDAAGFLDANAANLGFIARDEGPGRRTPARPVATPRSRSSGRASDYELHTGIVQPVLVIGLGGLGIETLSKLRSAILAEFGSPEAVPQIRMLGIDTDPDRQGVGTAFV